MPTPTADEPRGFSFFARGREAKPQDSLGVTAGQVIGDFRLLESLGQGGMGQVWEALQVSLGRTVALKLVRPDRVSEKTLALFSREARAGGRLHHPNLVSVHAHGADGGIAWIAMELVEGAWTLRDFLDDAAKAAEVPEGLALPSEAQWEHGARGGTTWPRWVGERKEALMAGQVNIADRSYVRAGGSAGSAAELPELDDGKIVHAEVGHYPANQFGLHEVLGNVWEWCLDGWSGYRAVPQTDPVNPWVGSANRIARGGSFSAPASYVRSADRYGHTPATPNNDLGLRPAQGITP